MPEPSATGLYITPEGAKKLRAELDQLWRVQRPEVTRRVSEAAALGDRSENADYQYGKQQLREIDRRIRYLGKRIDQLTVIDRLPGDRQSVYFGAWVSLEDEQGNVTRYRIVGSDEIDLKQGWISIDSPVARRLLRKKIGSEIPWSQGTGSSTLRVVGIEYQPPEDSMI